MKIRIILIVTTIIVSSIVAVAYAKRTAPDYFSQEATIIRVGTGSSGQAIPLVVFLPATDMHAEKLYKRFSGSQGMSDYVALIPAGKPTRSEYQADFWSYLLGYESNLLRQISKVQQSYHIDNKQMYLQGFSLGGDLAWALMVRNKELFAGATILGSRMSYPIKAKELDYLRDHNRRLILLMGDTDDSARRKGMLSKQQIVEKSKILTVYHVRSGAHALPPSDVYSLTQAWMMYKKEK